LDPQAFSRGKKTDKGRESRKTDFRGSDAMITHLDLNLILRETDVENLVASRLSPEPYSVAAEKMGEVISRLNPEEITEDSMKHLIAGVWQKTFLLTDADMINRMPLFQPIIKRILDEVDHAQELDPS
jgi:hypothetical protein